MDMRFEHLGYNRCDKIKRNRNNKKRKAALGTLLLEVMMSKIGSPNLPCGADDPIVNRAMGSSTILLINSASCRQKMILAAAVRRARYCFSFEKSKK